MKISEQHLRIKQMQHDNVFYKSMKDFRCIKIIFKRTFWRTCTAWLQYFYKHTLVKRLVIYIKIHLQDWTDGLGGKDTHFERLNTWVWFLRPTFGGVIWLPAVVLTYLYPCMQIMCIQVHIHIHRGNKNYFVNRYIH